MPANPKVLPCGHQFCRKCIQDLVQYQDDRNADACCPMCRGPLQKLSAKKLWAEAKSHETAGQEYYRMQQVEARMSSANRFSMHSQREYRLAVEKLEECLLALKQDQFVHKASRFSSPARQEAKRRHQQSKVLRKLIEVVPLARYDDSDERTIQLLRTVLEETKLPMPQLHLKLARLLHRQLDNDLLPETILEYQRVLQFAKGSRGRLARRQAKKLEGPARYGLARCYHQLGSYKRACREYKNCERLGALHDYGLAAECHFSIGNYIQAMDYTSMQLRNESPRPTVETCLLMAKICKAYFFSREPFSCVEVLEYQSRCETYRWCVRRAQLLARHDLHRQECAEHVECLHRLLYPTHKQRTIIPSYVVTSYSDKDDEEEDVHSEDYYSFYYGSQDLEETEDCDSVEL